MLLLRKACLSYIKKKPNDYISSIHFNDFDRLIERVNLINIKNLDIKFKIKMFFLTKKKICTRNAQKAFKNTN